MALDKNVDENQFVNIVRKKKKKYENGTILNDVLFYNRIFFLLLFLLFRIPRKSINCFSPGYIQYMCIVKAAAA